MVRRVSLVALALALLAGSLLGGGCGSTSSPPDARVDRGPMDLRRERGGDGVRDAPREAGRDLLRDTATDMREPDLPSGDAAIPPPATLLYAVATAPDSFGLRTVSSTGKGKPTPLAGWAGYVDLEPLSLAGLQERVPLDPTRPRPTKEVDPAFQGIALPSGLGTLHYFHRQLLGTSGLLAVRPGGALDVILEVPGVYSETLQSRVALDAAGKVGAVVQGTAQLLLFRTDGQSFASGTSWADVTPAATTLPLAQIKPRSLTVAGAWIYCVARESGGVERLLRAPLDGSAALQAVALPQSGGLLPVLVGDQPALSADGKKLAWPAGAAGGQDLYVVDVASGVAVNVTGSPGSLAERGDEFGYYNGLLALSPTGTLVAFVRLLAGEKRLTVARTDGVEKPVVVNDAVRFMPDVTTVYNLHFADETNLLFMAGRSSTELDLYRWDHALAAASNLTGGGSKATPFDGLGRYAPQAGWISPQRKWLWIIGYDSASEAADLVGVSLATLVVVKATSQTQTQWTPGSLVACAATGKLYFAAKPNPTIYSNEVWVIDQEQGTPATKLTTMNPSTGYWFVYNLTLSAGCDRLAWSSGGGYNVRDLWTLKTTGGAAKKITPAPMFVGNSLAFGPGAASVLYSSGGASDQSTLKSIPVFGAVPTQLDTAAGLVHIFAAY